MDNSIEFKGKIEVYVQDKCNKCKGKLKTNVQYEILSKTDHSCVPKLAEVEVKVKLDNYRIKELGKTCLCLYMQFIRKNCRLRLVTDIPKYDIVKTGQCKERRNVLCTE